MINKTVSEDYNSVFGNKNKVYNLGFCQSDWPIIHKKPLTVFSTQVSFLSRIFSRDKIEVILQVQSSYQKVLNFLNFLNVSLQSFNFTNEKEWILMKDEIERYLTKYEKNVSKMLEVRESDLRTRV